MRRDFWTALKQFAGRFPFVEDCAKGQHATVLQLPVASPVKEKTVRSWRRVRKAEASGTTPEASLHFAFGTEFRGWGLCVALSTEPNGAGQQNFPETAVSPLKFALELH